MGVMEELYPPSEPTAETLDPEDWDALRALGHRMLDDMLTHVATVRERPVWQPVPGPVRAKFREDLPRRPQGASEVYAEFTRSVLPYPLGNAHPRFWGWVMGNGTPLAMLADMLASGMNPNVAGYDQAAVLVESQILDWFKEILGLPATASGLMTGGGSLANLIGLAVARHAKAGFDVRGRGLQGGPRLVVYASTEVHNWIDKSVELMGFGAEGLRRLPVDENWRVDLRALRGAIREDRRRGRRPIAVIGSVGTVNTAATDDLAALRRIADEEDLWLHLDGAFGSLAALSPRYAHLVEGQGRADSVAFDMHKWMYLPFEAGIVLIRDAAAHRAAFHVEPSYLATNERGLLTEPMTFATLGIDLSRGFRALKVWMSLKAHGVDAFGRLIEQNIEQAHYLQALLAAQPQTFELIAPTTMNVVVFRFNPGGRSEAELERLNRELLMRIQESGVAVPSSTVLGGRFALRVAITNHRSRRSDFDLFVEESKRIASELGAESPPVAPPAGNQRA